MNEKISPVYSSKHLKGRFGGTGWEPCHNANSQCPKKPCRSRSGREPDYPDENDTDEEEGESGPPQEGIGRVVQEWVESTNVSWINSTSEVPPEQLDTMDDPVDTEGELSRAVRDTSGKIFFLIHCREEHAADMWRFWPSVQFDF